MNRKLATIIGLQAFLIVVLFWVLVFYGKDEYEALSQGAEDSIETQNRVSTKSGIAVISVSAATQAQSEIKTTALKASLHQASLSSYGNVIGIDSLTELRSRYLAINADADILRTTVAHNKIEYNRQYELNLDDKNVSDKVVASALATIKADEAKITAAESGAKNIADNMRQLWGEMLTKQALNQSINTLFQNLINAKEVLIQITLPFDAAEPSANSSILVAPTAAPSHMVRAYYISRAPVSNATMQGKTYFYHAAATDLRSGMQVKILSTQSKANASGVNIPNSAVVWYGGKPWVYQKLGADQFSRLPINTEIEVEDGWFYQGSLKPNDQIVTSGAQLLLSEEFKSQITNENED